MLNRRELIASIGAVGTVAIAGCSSITGRGPEGTVEQFFEAINQGDLEKADELVYQLDDQSAEFTIEVTSTEEVSSAELAEIETTRSYGETEEELQNTKQDIRSETGADEVAWVLTEFEQDGETGKIPIPVIKTNGEWKVGFF